MTWPVPARIETERLVLRRYAPDDAVALSEVTARNKEHLVRYMAWAQDEPQTVEQRVSFIETVGEAFDAGTEFTMGMFDRVTGAFLGGTGFHTCEDHGRLEIGYWIDADHQGRGLVTEAAAALTLVALELLRVEVVAISHAPSNQRSAAIPASLGYVRAAPAASGSCTDGDSTVAPVEWHATRASLDAEPLRSLPRPRAFDADGTELPWHA